MKSLIETLCLTFVLSISVAAQAGGTYDLSHSVIAGGGGSNSSGGTFRIDGTIGQNIAGTTSTGGTYSLRGGFWATSPMAPTAAMVSISGSVRTSHGAGIRSVIVTLSAQDGSTRMTQTGTFGRFRIDGVEAGQTYVLTITSRRYTFAESTRVLNVTDNITGIDFVADP